MKSSSNQFNCNSITRSGQSDAICRPPSHPPTTTTSRSYNSNDAALPTTHNHPIRSIHNHQHPFNRFQRNKIQKPNQKKEKESKKEEEVEEEEEEEEEEGAAADHFTWADRGRLFLLRRIWWHRVCISRFKSSSFPLSNPPIGPKQKAKGPTFRPRISGQGRKNETEIGAAEKKNFSFFSFFSHLAAASCFFPLFAGGPR